VGPLFPLRQKRGTISFLDSTSPKKDRGTIQVPLFQRGTLL
jgi:hypothetical protein